MLTGTDLTDQINFNIDTQPLATQGFISSFSGVNGSFSFSPFPDFCGTASFAFSATEVTGP